MILADHQDAGEFALGAGRRTQADGLEAADLAEPALQFVHQEERSLGAAFVSKRVQLGEAGQARRVFVDLGVVFHGA